MFGATDRILVFFRRFFPWSLKGMRYLKERTDKKSKEVWVCFIPFFSYNLDYVRKRVIPSNVSSLVYVFPKVPVFPDPKRTKAFLDKVYFDAFKEIKLLKKQGKRINFIGHSLPNVLMFRLMKKFDFGKAVAISPGANLADCIWESIATKHVKDKAIEEGMNLRYFKKILRDYNPEDNVRKMRGKIELYAGKFDPMIPFEQAKRVEVALKKKGNKVKLHRFNFSGHTTTILSFKH